MNRLLAARVLTVLRVSTGAFLRLPLLAETSVTPEPGRTLGALPFIAHRLSRGLPLVFVIVMAFAVGLRGAHGAGLASISVSPATATVSVGADISLDIDAANVSQPGLGGYVIVFQWDPAVLTLTSLADSGWVTSGQVIVICTTPTIDNPHGTAELDCTPLYAFGSGVTTSGPRALANAIFHANAPGTTMIDLSGSSLQNPSNVDIASTHTNGSVTVAASSVGGIAEAPDVAALPAVTAEPPSRARARFAASIVAGALVVAAGAGVLRMRRRRA